MFTGRRFTDTGDAILAERYLHVVGDELGASCNGERLTQTEVQRLVGEIHTASSSGSRLYQGVRRRLEA